jgi:hypothetical protein
MTESLLHFKKKEEDLWLSFYKSRKFNFQVFKVEDKSKIFASLEILKTIENNPQESKNQKK